MAAAQRPAGGLGPGVSRHRRDPAVSGSTRLGSEPTRDVRRSLVARAGGRRRRGRGRAADSLSLAFLVLLEELTPLERASYLLHDIFGYSFEEVAGSLGRSPAACRQLGSRARKHVEARRQRFDADLEHGRELTDRFLAACATGDLSGLLSMLSEDVVVWTDGGGKVRAAMRPVVGPYRSSRFLLNVAKKVDGRPLAVLLNGQPATVFVDDGVVVSALVLDILEGVIVGVRAYQQPREARASEQRLRGLVC